MEKILIDHEVHKVEKPRWEPDDGIERYEIRDEYGYILALDYGGGYYLFNDYQKPLYYEYFRFDFLDHDEAYDLAYEYEQTEQYILERDSRLEEDAKQEERNRKAGLYQSQSQEPLSIEPFTTEKIEFL